MSKKGSIKPIATLLLILATLTSCHQFYGAAPDCSHLLAQNTGQATTSQVIVDSQVQVESTSQQAEGSVATEPYTWQNVPISGMGFVTGVMIHPHVLGLIYVRTDVGGLYRWNASTSSWLQLMDGLPEHYSIESIALDFSNPDIIYAATGDGEVVKSVNQGKTWTSSILKTPAGEPVYLGGNDEWRWAGERLAVDPTNSQILYFGSRQDGLYRSLDGAKTWSQVASFPTKGDQGGIAFVVFDRNSARGDRVSAKKSSAKKSEVLYAGVMGSGVYRSDDGGETWLLLSGGPDSSQNPQQAVMATDGRLYVSFFTTPANPQGSVWSYQAGTWTQITPEPGQNYAAITGDPNNPNTVMVATYPFTPEGLYRTTDGGKHWQSIDLKVNAVPWWPKWHLYTLTGGLAINPHQPQQVWLTTGFGVLRTDDITARPSQWSACMDNLEELVVFVVKSPPVLQGARLFSGVADMDGFRHESLTTIPEQTYDRGEFGETTGIDFSEANPNIIVRVGSSPGAGGREDSQQISGTTGMVRSAYSADNGRSWQPFTHPPVGSVNGKVAVSASLQANGYPIIVWAPQGELYPHRSLDGGKTWLPVEGAPNRTTDQLWFSNQPIASDRVDGNLFYLYKYNEQSNEGIFYRSIDGGATWQKTFTGLPNYWLHAVKAAPGMRGEVWLSVRGHRLYRSSDAGTRFIALANIQQAEEVTFGKPALGRQNPTVFIYGMVNQTWGLFRSDDASSLSDDAAQANWVKVSTDQQLLSNVNYLEGDRQLFGRVYVGTGGRGILYGDIK